MSHILKNGLDYNHNIEFVKGLQTVLDKEGCIYDIGCWTGTLSFLCAQFLIENNIDKKIYLFDTFDGHPSERRTEEDSSWNFPIEGFKNVCIDDIKRTFAQLNFSNYELVKGDVCETIKQVSETPAFISLDLNYYASTKCALEALNGNHYKHTIIWEDDFNNIQGINKAYTECPFVEEINLNQSRGSFFKFVIKNEK